MKSNQDRIYSNFSYRVFLNRLRGSGKPGDDMLPQQPPPDAVHDPRVPQRPLPVGVQGLRGRCVEKYTLPDPTTFPPLAGEAFEKSFEILLLRICIMN